MKTLFGIAKGCDLEGNTITIKVEGEIYLQAGKYALMPIDEYMNLLHGVNTRERPTLPVKNVSHRKLIDAEIGDYLVCLKEVKPAKNYKVGDKYQILDKRLQEKGKEWMATGLQIQTREGKRWIPFKNHYGRWAYLPSL